MYEVSLLRKDKSLTDEMFQKCKEYIAETTSQSTRFYFSEKSFYQQLPVSLQLKLVKSVLYHERITLDYFFEDKNGKNKASDTFITTVLASLDSGLYAPGQVIIEQNSKVRELVFIAQGTCKLYGYYNQSEE